MAQERLHKALAMAGVSSRRLAEQMIVEGRVRLNGTRVTEMGLKVDTESDQVLVDGKKVRFRPADQELVYFLLNKPLSVLTTAKDDRGRKTVMDLVKGASGARIFPVGRLDYDAEGALLLTNDGDLANKLIHPRHHVPKTYMVKVKAVPAEDKLDKLRRGIYLEDGPTGPCQIEVVQKARVNTWVQVILKQGKNRQLKRMFWRIKHPVMKIVRTHFAGITTEGLAPGQYRSLTKRELASLRQQAGVDQ